MFQEIGVSAPAPRIGAAVINPFQQAVERHQAGDLDRAASLYREVLESRPRHAEALNNLAGIEFGRGNIAAALALGLAAVEAEPRASFLVNFGRILDATGDLEKSAGAFRLAARLDPNDPVAHLCLGETLAALEQWDKADAALMRAIELRPAADAYNALGIALIGRGDYDAALAFFAEALRLQPTSMQAANNLAGTFSRLGRHEEALEAHRLAAGLSPDSPEARLHYGLSLLRAGHFAEGWKEYEWRWRTRSMAPGRRPDAAPAWSGSGGADTVLLYGEQGFGDTLQFCRYAPLVADRGHKIVLEVQPELCRLLRQSFGSDRIAVYPSTSAVPLFSGLPPFDAQCSLMSLPHILGTTLETIPANVPYLHADPADVEHWRQVLRQELPAGRLRVGLVWAGNPRHGQAFHIREVDRRRSLSFEALRPLLTVPDVDFVSLQKRTDATPLADIGGPVLDLGARLTDFADTAAVVANLDLVVTVDTSMAHLVGGMGKPVWMLSRFEGCWRWLLDRDDSPWYPSMRILRQGADQRWEPVVAEMRQALAEIAARR